MKHTILLAALLSALSTVVYSDTTPAKPISTESPAATSSTPATANPTATPSSTSSITDVPTTPTPPATINCSYRIPATTTTIDSSLITTWAKQAAVQAFEFNPTTIDQELTALKLCFTDQGWQGFNDALQKSGNINAIKTQQLTVSSQVNGDVSINPVKDNQWKLTLPIQVVYQNDKEKLTQQLTVNLLVGRKISGDLGIMQIIAAPQPTSNPQQPASTPSPAAPVSGSEPSTAPTNTTPPVTSNGSPSHP